MTEPGPVRATGAAGPRVALVGYGSAGRGIHAPLLVAAGAAAAVVVTGNPERAVQARADLPGCLVVPTLDAALAAGVELAVLASPSGVHVEGALACVAAGVPVVIDKPMAVDAAGSRQIVAAAGGAQVPVTVFQNRRWDDENRCLARLLADEALGAVYRFERRWERWRPVPKDRWRENAAPEAGGGVLLDLGPHLVDSAVQFFGPVASVYAETAAHTTPAEDSFFLSLRHLGGVRSHLTASSVAAAPGPRTRVLGARGAYVVTEFEAEEQGFTLRGTSGSAGAHTGHLVVGGEHRPVPTPPGGHGDFYPAVFAALALPTPAERQAAMPVNPQDVVHVMEVLDAARRSAAQQQVVSLA